LYVFHEQALTHIIATQPLDRGIQKTLDARLLAAGMTYKDNCDPTNVHFIMRLLIILFVIAYHFLGT